MLHACRGRQHPPDILVWRDDVRSLSFPILPKDPSVLVSFLPSDCHVSRTHSICHVMLLDLPPEVIVIVSAKLSFASDGLTS